MIEPKATLRRAAGLVPKIVAGAAAIDRDRWVPTELVAELVAAGCFRMAVDTGHGGDELSLPEILEVLAELAYADGTVAWMVAQAALAQLVLAYLPLETLAEVYFDDPDAIVAGAFAPKGHVRHTDAGWHVNGRWPFVTGSVYARWLYVNCIVTEGSKIQLAADGTPVTRVALFRADEVTIEPTWHALGLRGSASNDVVVHHLVCPAARTTSLTQPPSLTSTLFSLPLLECGGFFVGAVALGIARAAVDDVAELAGSGKRPAFSSLRLADDRSFQHRLGKAFADHLAAGALLSVESGSAWAAARIGRVVGDRERAARRAATAQIVALAGSAVDACHLLARSTSVFEGPPLERRFRDLHTISQHAWAAEDGAIALGAILAGSSSVAKALV